MDEKREREAWIRAERYVAGVEPRRRDPRATLLKLAERAPAVGEADRYGGGMLAERLEGRVAELLGKEAAVWMPSGTMAQQIALRIHSRPAPPSTSTARGSGSAGRSTSGRWTRSRALSTRSMSPSTRTCSHRRAVRSPGGPI